jgi:hypothetical protein
LQEAVFDLPTSRVQTRVTLVEPDGRRTSREFIVRQATLTELAQKLAAAGLPLVQTWGGFEGAPYTLDSPRLVLLAERPAARELP